MSYSARRDEMEDLLDKGGDAGGSLIDKYNELYPYPKSLNEFQEGLQFNFIDYKALDEKYRDRFSRKSGVSNEKTKAEKIKFIYEELYIKNQGYNTKSKIGKKVALVYKWHRDNKDELGFELKSYDNFYIDRGLILLKKYKEEFDIEPVTGFFAKIYSRLSANNLLSDGFFKIKYSSFEKDQKLQALKAKLDEVSNFIQAKGRIPDRNARMKAKREVDKNIIDDLMYEGSLRDRIYFYSKKCKQNNFKYKEEKRIVEEHFRIWGWKVNGRKN